jgi:transcriptional regulator
VHIYGRFRLLNDTAEHHRVMIALTEQHESGRPEPWRADFDSSMIQRMVRATVAFEIVIAQCLGKFKLSQNRSAEDRANVITALADEGDDNSSGVAELMRARG